MSQLKLNANKFVQSLREKLDKLGYSYINILNSWVPEQSGLGFQIVLTDGDIPVDKFTLLEDNNGVYFIRTIFV